jgi:hypothetical protein
MLKKISAALAPLTTASSLSITSTALLSRPRRPTLSLLLSPTTSSLPTRNMTGAVQQANATHGSNGTPTAKSQINHWAQPGTTAFDFRSMPPHESIGDPSLLTPVYQVTPSPRRIPACSRLS